MPVSAASFGQIAVLLEVVSRDEHRDLSKELHARLKTGRPTSYSKLLLRRGVSPSIVKQVLRRGASLVAVRCDACGTSIPQEKMPRRVEYPCPHCGSLVMGFAAFAKRDPAPALPPAMPAPASEPPLIADGEAQTIGYHRQIPIPIPLPTPGALPNPGALNTPRTLDPEEAMETALFREVFVLPAEARGAPRDDDETTAAFGMLTDSGGEHGLDASSGVRAPIPAAPPRPAHAAGPRGDGFAAGPRGDGFAAGPRDGGFAAGPGTPVSSGVARAPGGERPPSSQRASSPDEPGRLGPFKVVRGLGQGSMGRVYLAEHEGNGERVALKLLKPQFASDQEYLKRFHREAKAAAGDRHEHVVAVIDSGHDEALKVNWIAFEFVEGGSLEDLLRKRGGSLPEEEALKIALGIARALEFTAGRGIVHRDVKPANVLLTRDGQPKLADLGMARHLDLSTRVTAPGIVLGTPAYLAPEQAMGVEDIDGRADLYALGVCLWEMLTGRLPLDEGVTTEQLIVRHVDEDVPDVRTYKPSVSDATAQIVAGLCARDRAVRYPQPQAAVADIERVLAGKAPLGARGRLALQKRQDAPGAKVSLKPPTPGEPPAPEPTESQLAATLVAPPGATPKKGGGGCFLLLVLGFLGLLVVGGGGAALWWFVLRHR